MDLSVIICTYNRCESLRRTLQTCCDLVIPAGVTWELLVVDNNSTDHTKQVCEEFTGKLPIRYLFEQIPGKSNALNRAVREGCGELLLFTDDDVSLDRLWLSELYKTASIHCDITFFGGKVLSRWEQPPPNWITDNLMWLSAYPRLDLGECEKVMNTGQPGEHVIGANIAFRKEVYVAGYSYRTDIGPRGSDHSRMGRVGQEEIDFQEALFRSGHKGLYVPSAVVFHHDPPHRMTERYIRKYYRCAGRSEALCSPFQDRSHDWFGVPRYLWKGLLKHTLQYGIARPFGPSRVWLYAECRMSFCLGMILSYRDDRHRRRQ